jgi:cell wall-associated NlpC family hydrolase
VPSDILRTAECFLGVPYLWGGTTADGIDCSGFTQLVYRLNGVGLDRDADQQAVEGRSVSSARPGDLFFFGDERITHTAIATGEREFLHAPQSGAVVERATLTPARNLRAIRRYLPDEL